MRLYREKAIFVEERLRSFDLCCRSWHAGYFVNRQGTQFTPSDYPDGLLSRSSIVAILYCYAGES